MFQWYVMTRLNSPCIVQKTEVLIWLYLMDKLLNEMVTRPITVLLGSLTLQQLIKRKSSKWKRIGGSNSSEPDYSSWRAVLVDGSNLAGIFFAQFFFSITIHSFGWRWNIGALINLSINQFNLKKRSRKANRTKQWVFIYANEVNDSSHYLPDSE